MADDLFAALFSEQHVPARLVDALIRARDGMLAQLDQAARERIAAEAGKFGNRIKLRSASPERLRDALLQRRPDLRDVLVRPEALVWLAGELGELRSLAGVQVR